MHCTTMDLAKKAARLGIEESEYRELLRLFVETSAGELSALAKAVKIGDIVKAAQLIHSFRGAATNLDLEEFAARGKNLEVLIRAGSVSGLEDKIGRLLRDTGELARLL